MDLGGALDLTYVSSPGFSICGTSFFCEDPSAPCGFSSVSSLSRAFCLKPRGVFSCYGGGVVASPYSTLGKPLRLCIWKVRKLFCKSDGNVCTLSNTSS
jgi:hypothetical protein